MNAAISVTAKTAGIATPPATAWSPLIVRTDSVHTVARETAIDHLAAVGAVAWNSVSESLRHHRPRLSRTLAGGLVALLLCACAGRPYQLDYRPETRFEDLRSYAVQVPAAASGAGDSLNDQRVRDAVQAVFDARGLRLAEDVAAADFVVTWRFIEVAELYREGASFGVGYGFGLNSRSGVGVSMATRPPLQENLQQKLVLDLMGPADRQIFWSAEARDPLRETATPAERQAEISALVAAMLEDFPPRP